MQSHHFTIIYIFAVWMLTGIPQFRCPQSFHRCSDRLWASPDVSLWPTSNFCQAICIWNCAQRPTPRQGSRWTPMPTFIFPATSRALKEKRKKSKLRSSLPCQFGLCWSVTLSSDCNFHSEMLAPIWMRFRYRKARLANRILGFLLIFLFLFSYLFFSFTLVLLFYHWTVGWVLLGNAYWVYFVFVDLNADRVEETGTSGRVLWPQRLFVVTSEAHDQADKVVDTD